MPQQKVVHVVPGLLRTQILDDILLQAERWGDLETSFAGRVEAELARDESFDTGPDNGVNDALLFHEAGGGDGGDDSIFVQRRRRRGRW
jgi:hypothetical protein